jgi:hypothetical protein
MSDAALATVSGRFLRASKMVSSGQEIGFVGTRTVGWAAILRSMLLKSQAGM